MRLHAEQVSMQVGPGVLARRVYTGGHGLEGQRGASTQAAAGLHGRHGAPTYSALAWHTHVREGRGQAAGTEGRSNGGSEPRGWRWRR